MDPFKPTDQHRKLEKLVGSWHGDEKLGAFPGMKHKTAVGTWNARLDLGGSFLVVDYIQTADGKEVFRGHGVIGWNAKKKAYTLHWFDSYGSPPSEPGYAQEEKNSRWIFVHDYPTHKGHTIFEVSKNELRFKVEMSEGGKPFTTAIEGRYTKDGALQQARMTH